MTHAPRQRAVEAIANSERSIVSARRAIIDAMPARPEDTSVNAARVQSELLRAMSPQQRAEILTALTLAVQDLAMAGLRQVYPNASDDELRLRLAARRLGEETVRRIWGWPADEL